ncbi:MAG TPA: DUF742 domain-containing protein [Actinoplanes sp.]|jgi:hypothetical protein
MTYPDSAGPAHPARPGVRPFLQPGPTSAGGYRPGSFDDEPPTGDPPATLRPFVLTAGRTDGVDPDIGMETQVSANAGAAPRRLSPEMRAIVQLCEKPVSVAEISARLKLHFGVTRILVGDLRAAGQLNVHVLAYDNPDPDTIMRVIRGLRAIS